MVNKLATDHLWEWDPRGACNIDMSRNGIAYDSAKDLRIGFEALTRRWRVIRQLRVRAGAARRRARVRDSLTLWMTSRGAGMRVAMTMLPAASMASVMTSAMASAVHVQVWKV